jgi:hypothetical protein
MCVSMRLFVSLCVPVCACVCMCVRRCRGGRTGRAEMAIVVVIVVIVVHVRLHRTRRELLRHHRPLQRIAQHARRYCRCHPPCAHSVWANTLGRGTLMLRVGMRAYI